MVKPPSAPNKEGSRICVFVYVDHQTFQGDIVDIVETLPTLKTVMALTTGQARPLDEPRIAIHSGRPSTRLEILDVSQAVRSSWISDISRSQFE